MAAALYGLKPKEPPWTMAKQGDFIQITITLDGIKSAEQIEVDIIDGQKLVLNVKALYRLNVSLPSKVKDDEEDGVKCTFTKSDGRLMMKLPLAEEAAPPPMDPEEAMMMGMDPGEMEMMGMGAPPARSTTRRLSVDVPEVVRSIAEIVGYFLMKREKLGRERCEHVMKHMKQPAGWLDIKLKKMFRACKCKSSSHGWTCLTCYEVFCANCGPSRTAHYKETGHGLTMNCKCETWCWECAHDPLDERITPVFVRMWAIKHGKKPADILEALEECQGVDLKTSVAEILGTRGELGAKFKDYNERMDGMMQQFDALVVDLASCWGDISTWDEQAEEPERSQDSQDSEED